MGQLSGTRTATDRSLRTTQTTLRTAAAECDEEKRKK